MNSIGASMPGERKITGYLVGSCVLALLFCTYLRISFLFIYPLLIPAVYYGYKWKVDKNAVILFSIAIFCWLLSFRNGFYLKYNLLSFYFFVPFVLLLLAAPQKTNDEKNYLKMLMAPVTVLVVISNIVGIFQYIKSPFDDSFSGLYGTFTVSQNGLSVLNSILFFYHLIRYQHSKKVLHLLLAIFFIICFVMGFYGAGLIAFIGALILSFFRVRVKNMIQLLLLLGITIPLVALVMRYVSPLTLDYNLAIIDRFLHPHAVEFPRKLIIFQNYFNAYIANPVDLLFGSGPGTFNSRSAFMVGSPTYFNAAFIKSDVQPFYFQNYAYTLWNSSNTGRFDGFMNQPFTSILALPGEYGLIFTSFLFYVLLGKYKAITRTGYQSLNSLVKVDFKMFRFCSILILLLLVIDNYMEYPEIIAFLIILAKLSHQRMKTLSEIN